MWEALPQMPQYAQVLGGSSCLACGSSSNAKLGKSEVSACGRRRRARRQHLRILPLPGKIVAASLDGGQLSLRSVQLLDSASLQRTRAVLHDVVYSLTQFGGILPAYAEEETSDVAAESLPAYAEEETPDVAVESLPAEQDISVGDQAENPPSVSPSVDDTVVNASVDSPPTSSGEEVVYGGTGIEAGSDNVPAGEEIVSGGTGYEAGSDNVPVGEEIVSGGTGYEASGLEQAAPSSAGVDSGSDTLVNTVVDKPRALTLDYDDLVGGSGRGNEGSNPGEISEDPFGAINDAFASAQDAVANSISNVKKFFENAIDGIVNPSKNLAAENGDVTLQTNATNSAESGFGGTDGNPFQMNSDSPEDSGFGGTGGNPFQEAVDSVQVFYQDTVSAVEQAVQNVADGITGSIQNTTDSVTGAINSVQLNIESSIDNTKAAAQGKVLDSFGIFYPGTAANDALKVVVDGVKANVGAAVVTAQEYAVQVYTSTKGNLPEETQDALNNAESTVSEYSKPVLSALEQVSDFFLQLLKAFGVDLDNPIVATLAFSLAVSYLGVSYLRERYGGYSGDLNPQTALEILQKEGDVALVDIRPQEERDGAGIPDLRRGARFRNGSVEVVKVDPAIKKQVRNSRDIDNVVTAAIIRNLKIVKADSKVILLDADGRQSKDLARALRKLGVQKQYRIDGGFRAWVTAGLPIRGEGPLTPIAILKEETAAIVEEVKPTTDGVILVALGLVAGGYAVYEWEKALQLIGTFAVGQFIYNKIQGYQSAEEVKADIRNLGKPFLVLGGGIAWLISQVQPKKLQLATTPSTSAVQDKVLQAAAKHGPHVPEVDEQGEEPAEAAADAAAEAAAEAAAKAPEIEAVSETTTTTTSA